MIKKRFLCTLICVVLAMSVASLSGCNGGEEETTPENGERVEFEFFAHQLNLYAQSDSILEKIEDKFNVKLTLMGAPLEGWMERLSLLINADEVPDTFFFIPNAPAYSASYLNYIRSEMIVPVSDYVSKEKTPHLARLLSSNLYKDLDIDGDYYFIPAPAHPTNHVMYVRQDWLENLGMEHPETIEEFTAMLAAFTNDDPNQSGKDDTYGLTASNIFGWLENFMPSFGISPGWSQDEDGVWHMDAFTPEYRNYLSWLNEIYTKGYMKDEFFLFSQTEANLDFHTGKAGVLIYNGDAQVSNIINHIAQTQPDAKLDFLPMPDGVAPGGYVGTGGWWGGWSFAYSAKDPELLAQIFDYFHSYEGQKLIRLGIEGVHYDYDDDGEVVPNTEARMAEGDGKFIVGSDGVARATYNFGSYFGSMYEIDDEGDVEIKIIRSRYTEWEATERAWEMTNKNIVYMYPPTILDLPSEYASINSRVVDAVNIYAVRIIAGQTDIDTGMERMLRDAKNAGYNRMQEILEEQHSDD